MGSAEGIVFAFGALGEAGEAVFLAERADALTAAGQDLVRIALVSNVEDQAIIRRLEDLVDCDRQLDDAKACPQMTTRFRHGIDHLVAHFARQLRQIAVLDGLQISRELDLVQQRRIGHGCHGALASSTRLGAR